MHARTIMYAFTHLQTCNKKEDPIALRVEKGLREPWSSCPIAEGTGWIPLQQQQHTHTHTHIIDLIVKMYKGDSTVIMAQISHLSPIATMLLLLLKGYPACTFGYWTRTPWFSRTFLHPRAIGSSFLKF